MTAIRIDPQVSWDRLTLVGQRAHTVGPELLDELAEVLEDARHFDPEAPARPMILSGEGAFFSAGLDLITLCDLPREALSGFLERFRAVFLDLACCPRPTVVAVNGHAMGAGCLLLLACDRRVAAATLPETSRRYRIGLKVAAMALPLPDFAAALVRASVPNPSHRMALALAGDLHDPREAQRMGLVDRVVPPGSLLDAAAQEAARLATCDGRTAFWLKSQMKPDLFAERGRAGDPGPFLEAWFSEATQAQLRRAVAALRSSG